MTCSTPATVTVAPALDHCLSSSSAHAMSRRFSTSRAMPYGVSHCRTRATGIAVSPSWAAHVVNRLRHGYVAALKT